MTTRRFTVGVLAVAVVLAGVLSQYASPHPDGLMRVAEAQGFGSSASAGVTGHWPLAGYVVAGVQDARLAGGLAGVIGCSLCFALVGLVTGSGRRATINTKVIPFGSNWKSALPRLLSPGGAAMRPTRNNRKGFQW